MDYPYVPMPARGPLVFPGGARLALIVTINLETWDLVKPSGRPYYAGGPAILPDPLPGDIPDYPNFTWREYGQRVGLWRLLEAFDAAGAPASCTANAVTFERRAAMTQAVLDRNWELLAHNWEQGELLSEFAKHPDREREVIARTLQVYEAHVGRKARGWLSSSLRGTANTAAILKDLGCDFFCDLMNDDQPYLLDTPYGPLVSIPYSNEINDFTMVTRRNYTTDQFRDALIEELDVLYAEGGRIMNVGLHPHVSGRAHRVRGVRQFLEHAKTLPDLWWAKRAEIADWYPGVAAAHMPR